MILTPRDDVVCVPCDNIPPCPPCTAHQQCQQLYPNDCHICPSNVCVTRPHDEAHSKGIVGGVVGAIVAAIFVGFASYVTWKVLSIRHQRRSKRLSSQDKASVMSISAPQPMTQVVLHDTMQGPPAHFYSPPLTSAAPAQDDPLTTSIKPTSAMYRISEATETSTQVRSTPLDAGSGPQWERAWPDVPQDELPLRRVFDATFPDTPTPVQTQATRVTLSKACPRLVRGPVYK